MKGIRLRMKILVFLIIFVFAQEVMVYTGNQNYSHRMVLVSFFAVTNQLQLQYRI